MVAASFWVQTGLYMQLQANSSDVIRTLVIGKRMEDKTWFSCYGEGSSFVSFLLI